MFWRLHKAIFDEQLKKAIEVIKNLGDSYQIVEGTPSQLKDVPFEKFNEPALAITTLQDAQRLIRKDYPSTPWLFFNNTHYRVSYWLSRIDKNIPVLNRDCIFIPYGQLKNLSSSILNAISTKKIFMKPDSGNKVFTGFSIDNNDYFLERLEDQLKFSHIDPEEMIVMSSNKSIENIEWRFWIAERKIIGYTPYSWDLEPKLLTPPQKIMELAEKMTQNSWQPDYIYVADFCLTSEGQPMLIEINAASTSGIYQVDLQKLLPAMKKTCIREYNGEIEM